MNLEHVKVLVTKRMQEAAECLEDGKYLLSAGRGAQTVVNRAYYAAFYAVLALLQTVGKTPRKHRGTLTLFDTEFIRTGVLQKELSDSFPNFSMHDRKTTIAGSTPYCRRKPLNSSQTQSNLFELSMII